MKMSREDEPYPESNYSTSSLKIEQLANSDFRRKTNRRFWWVSWEMLVDHDLADHAQPKTSPPPYGIIGYWPVGYDGNKSHLWMNGLVVADSLDDALNTINKAWSPRVARWRYMSNLPPGGRFSPPEWSLELNRWPWKPSGATRMLMPNPPDSPPANYDIDSILKEEKERVLTPEGIRLAYKDSEHYQNTTDQDSSSPRLDPDFYERMAIYYAVGEWNEPYNSAFTDGLNGRDSSWRFVAVDYLAWYECGAFAAHLIEELKDIKK